MTVLVEERDFTYGLSGGGSQLGIIGEGGGVGAGLALSYSSVSFGVDKKGRFCYSEWKRVKVL